MAEEILITDMAPLGDGIGVTEQARVYVERALPGDKVLARVKRAGGVLRGEVAKVIEASPHRIAAPCPHYDTCSGCALQHAEESFYRQWKSTLARTALAKQGIAPDIWRDAVFLPDSRRRRVTFAAIRKNQRVTLGYFRRRSHDVADIASCLVAEPAIMDLRGNLSAALAPVLQEGKPADIFIQAVDGACEIVITGPVGARGVPDLAVHEALGEIAQTLKIARIFWRAREHDMPELMVERAPLYARFGDLAVALPPLAFLQPTTAGEAALVAAVMAALPAQGTFADLFSGCGTFTGPMLARGAVDAFDTADSAVRALDAARTSSQTGSRPFRALRRDLFRDPLTTKDLARYDAVVFDPPRAGAEAQAKELALSDVPRVVGVSCAPATFARDARILAAGGYRLESAQVVDQFTWSHHVELVGVFGK